MSGLAKAMAFAENRSAHYGEQRKEMSNSPTSAPTGHRQGNTQAAEGKKTEKVKRSEATVVTGDPAGVSLCFTSASCWSQVRPNCPR